jgi:nucleoside-diphosphate-sugar epimerase
MRVLIVGGNRFVGYLLAWRLLARGDEVVLLNRGTRPDPFGDRVERLRVDRTSAAGFASALEGRSFDATVDFAAFAAADVRTVVQTLGPRAGHYVFISTGQVYLVREGCPTPSGEQDYDGALMPRPDDAAELAQWSYGVDKRACEDVLVDAAGQGFTSTRIRLPMVNGELDYHRRLEGYLWRILDGGPVILPDGGPEVCRHVYGLDVACALAALLGEARSFGTAFNLCQQQMPTVFDLVGLLIDTLGAPDNRVAIPRHALEGLCDRELSPFSQRWMSLLDPGRAQRELGFVHRPLDRYLEAIVASFLAHVPSEPPFGLRQREAERALVRRLRARASDFSAGTR